MADWGFLTPVYNVGGQFGAMIYSAGAQVGKTVFNPPPAQIARPSIPSQAQVAQPSGITGGADYTGVTLPISQPIPAVQRPVGETFYVPAGEYKQIAIENAQMKYGPIAGNVGFYQISKSIYEGPGFTRRYGGVVSSGGPGALQSGMFSTEPLTPAVYTQESGGRKLSPLANVPLAAEMLKAPATYSRLGAEAYGGFVQPLDARVLQPGQEMGRYAAGGNLANLVSPTGVNQPKSQFETIPWSIETPVQPMARSAAAPPPYIGTTPAPFVSVGKEPTTIKTYQPDTGYLLFSSLGAIPASPVKPFADILKWKSSPGTMTETTTGIPVELPVVTTKVIGEPTVTARELPGGIIETTTTIPETTTTTGGTVTPVSTIVTPIPSGESTFLKEWDIKITRAFGSALPSKEAVVKSGYSFFHVTEPTAPPSVKGIVGGVASGYEWTKEHPVTFAERYGEAYAAGTIFRGITEISGAGLAASTGTKLEPIAKGLHWTITKAAPYIFAGIVGAEGIIETTAGGTDLSLERMGPRAGVFTASTVLPMTGAVRGYGAPETFKGALETGKDISYIVRSKTAELQFELGREPLGTSTMAGMPQSIRSPEVSGVYAAHQAAGGFEFAEESGVNPETLGLTQKAIAQKTSWLFEGRSLAGVVDTTSNWQANVPIGERILSNLPVIGVVSQQLVPAQTIGIRPSFMESPKAWGYGGYSDIETPRLRVGQAPESAFIGFGYGSQARKTSGVVQVIEPAFATKETRFNVQVSMQYQEPEVTFSQLQYQQQSMAQEVMQQQRQRSTQRQMMAQVQEQKSLQEQVLMPAQVSKSTQRYRQELVFDQEQRTRQAVIFDQLLGTRQLFETVTIPRTTQITTPTTKITTILTPTITRIPGLPFGFSGGPSGALFGKSRYAFRERFRVGEGIRFGELGFGAKGKGRRMKL